MTNAQMRRAGLVMAESFCKTQRREVAEGAEVLAVVALRSPRLCASAFSKKTEQNSAATGRVSSFSHSSFHTHYLLHSLLIFPAVLLAFHKPFGTVSQFTPDGSKHRTLADFGFPKGVYPIGRLDAESEGLLLLSDEAELNARLLHPSHAHQREYWAQVERVPTVAALQQLARGLFIGGRKTLPCRAWTLDPQPEIPPREPPIRFRKNVPETWIALELIEGKNHQVRRMTATVGHPTLRLVRVRIGRFPLSPLPTGAWRVLGPHDRAAIFAAADAAC